MAGEMVEDSMASFIKKVIAREGYKYCLFQLAMPHVMPDIIQGALALEIKQVAEECIFQCVLSLVNESFFEEVIH
jgi:hypothetical protein